MMGRTEFIQYTAAQMMRPHHEADAVARYAREAKSAAERLADELGLREVPVRVNEGAYDELATLQNALDEARADTKAKNDLVLVLETRTKELEDAASAAAANNRDLRAQVDRLTEDLEKATAPRPSSSTSRKAGT